MNQEDRKTIEKRVVYVPEVNNSFAPGSVLSVEVGNGRTFLKVKVRSLDIR